MKEVEILEKIYGNKFCILCKKATDTFCTHLLSVELAVEGKEKTDKYAMGVLIRHFNHKDSQASQRSLGEMDIEANDFLESMKKGTGNTLNKIKTAQK